MYLVMHAYPVFVMHAILKSRVLTSNVSGILISEYEVGTWSSVILINQDVLNSGHSLNWTGGFLEIVHKELENQKPYHEYVTHSIIPVVVRLSAKF